jgi:hypothetical protein
MNSTKIPERAQVVNGVNAHYFIRKKKKKKRKAQTISPSFSQEWWFDPSLEYGFSS